MSIAPRNPYTKVGKARFIYEPAGYDRLEPQHRPEPGTIVVKVQPFGCPKNGTMRHCYIAPVENMSNYVLVQEASLTSAK